MDYGLPVTFDGKGYTLLFGEIVKNYPVGGLISEYCRLDPTVIKDIILDSPGLDLDVTLDNLSSTITEFHYNLLQKLDPVSGIMISVEFINTAFDWFTSKKEGSEDDFISQLDALTSEQIAEFIFEGTPFNQVGTSSVLQMMLSIYLGVAINYSITKYTFGQIIGVYDLDNDKRENTIEVFSQLYGTSMDFQHIDFRIINTEKGFESLYTIKTPISLLLFEMAHSIQQNTNYVKCSNCNQIFVPEGRCDTLYCSYPSPQNKEKTCREIGAQITRANKEKNDIVTREYRKVYMRYTMMAKRHPNDYTIKTTLDLLTSGMKTWRNKLSQGTATSEECLNWISTFR